MFAHSFLFVYLMTLPEVHTIRRRMNEYLITKWKESTWKEANVTHCKIWWAVRNDPALLLVAKILILC